MQYSLLKCLYCSPLLRMLRISQKIFVFILIAVITKNFNKKSFIVNGFMKFKTTRQALRRIPTTIFAVEKQ